MAPTWQLPTLPPPPPLPTLPASLTLLPPVLPTLPKEEDKVLWPTLAPLTLAPIAQLDAEGGRRAPPPSAPGHSAVTLPAVVGVFAALVATGLVVAPRLLRHAAGPAVVRPRSEDGEDAEGLLHHRAAGPA